MHIAATARRVAVRTAAAMAMAAVAAVPAHADTFTYKVDLRATAIGRDKTVFGFDVPPATSFLGDLSFTADLHSGVEMWPGSGYFQVATSTQKLGITIGTAAWTMAGSQNGHLWTDLTGNILAFELYFWTEPGFNGSTLAVVKNAASNLDWYASDATAGDGSCSFGPTGVVEGACISGAPGSAQLTAVVPEPSQFQLLATAFVAALGLLGLRRWRSPHRGR